jgi:long-chain acyl-CoA synthetase
MVPAHFVRILEVAEEERRQYNLTSLDLIVHAGAPCAVPLKRRVMEALQPAEIWELYGASEGGATRIGPKEWLEKPGSVGLPWPGVRISIRDSDGRELGANQEGVVWVTPPAGGFTYHNDPEKTSNAWRDGSFTVGDVGHLDDDGYLFLTDRASDMIIRGGVNIYPREIENAILEHPNVVDVAVFGIPEVRFGELIKAVVEVRKPTSEEELRTWLGARIAEFKVPHVIDFVDTLPRDANGKVLKRYMREQHWARQENRIRTS